MVNMITWTNCANTPFYYHTSLIMTENKEISNLSLFDMLNTESKESKEDKDTDKGKGQNATTSNSYGFAQMCVIYPNI